MIHVFLNDNVRFQVQYDKINLAPYHPDNSHPDNIGFFEWTFLQLASNSRARFPKGPVGDKWFMQWVGTEMDDRLLPEPMLIRISCNIINLLIFSLSK